jgi:hypothetical protein
MSNNNYLTNKLSFFKSNIKLSIFILFLIIVYYAVMIYLIIYFKNLIYTTNTHLDTGLQKIESYLIDGFNELYSKLIEKSNKIQPNMDNSLNEIKTKKEKEILNYITYREVLVSDNLKNNYLYIISYITFIYLAIIPLICVLIYFGYKFYVDKIKNN